MPTDIASGNVPLVSVICRTTGREELEEALKSITTQSYSNLELLVINAAAIDLGDLNSMCGNLVWKEVRRDGPLLRAAAANAGLDEASGDYLLFLDEDDWIAPNHIQSLQEALESNPAIGAAYSNTQKASKDGSLLDEEFKQDFDKRILMHDNYIAIHFGSGDRTNTT